MSGQVSFPHRSTTCRAPAWRASPIRRTTELTSQPWLHEKRWRRSPAGIGYSSVVPGALLSSCACARDESTQRYVDVRDRRPCNRDPSSESPRLSVATPDSAASRTAADRAGARRPSCSMTSSTARPARHPIRRSGWCRQTGRRSRTRWGSTDPSFGGSTATVGKTCSSTAIPISFCAPREMVTSTSAAWSVATGGAALAPRGKPGSNSTASLADRHRGSQRPHPQMAIQRPGLQLVPGLESCGWWFRWRRPRIG
jgi:hypothetical protein